MPDIAVGAQIFDFAFHPTHSTVYAALVTGEVKSYTYDEQGAYHGGFSERPSKKSCRALAMDEGGDKLWVAGKSKYIYTLDTTTGKLCETRADAHDSPINRVAHLASWLVTSGDDNGVIKLWDPRQSEVVRTYTHHSDFISDFLFLRGKKQLVATSADGTLSVVDVRSKNIEPLIQSENQEDELLSIVPIKGGAKHVVGTQLGTLSIFNKKSGWRDCVDRVPGHPHSVDTLCALPLRYPSSDTTILTGSSDGLLRVVQLFPTKLVGVVTDHGEFPIEKIAIERSGEGRWLGSIGHEEVLRMTDLEAVLNHDCDSDGVKDGETAEGNGGVEISQPSDLDSAQEPGQSCPTDEDDIRPGPPETKKRKRKQGKGVLVGKKKTRDQIDAEPSFFADL